MTLPPCSYTGAALLGDDLAAPLYGHTQVQIEFIPCIEVEKSRKSQMSAKINYSTQKIYDCTLFINKKQVGSIRNVKITNTIYYVQGLLD